MENTLGWFYIILIIVQFIFILYLRHTRKIEEKIIYRPSIPLIGDTVYIIDEDGVKSKTITAVSIIFDKETIEVKIAFNNGSKIISTNKYTSIGYRQSSSFRNEYEILVAHCRDIIQEYSVYDVYKKQFYFDKEEAIRDYNDMIMKDIENKSKKII